MIIIPKHLHRKKEKFCFYYLSFEEGQKVFKELLQQCALLLENTTSQLYSFTKWILHTQTHLPRTYAHTPNTPDAKRGVICSELYSESAVPRGFVCQFYLKK